MRVANMTNRHEHVEMRMLVVAVVLGVAGCASADDVEQTGRVVAALDAGDGAAPDPACNGTQFRHVCDAYPATAGSTYGVTAACTGTPFLPTDGDGGIAERPSGLAGCVSVGLVSLDGPAVARCCR